MTFVSHVLVLLALLFGGEPTVSNSDSGCHMDPLGVSSNSDSGCHWDPLGGSSNSDSGCIIDPLGGCRD